jgi:hypothetical protein
VRAEGLVCPRCGRDCTGETYFECERCGDAMCELCWGWGAEVELCAPCSMETGAQFTCDSRRRRRGPSRPVAVEADRRPPAPGCRRLRLLPPPEGARLRVRNRDRLIGWSMALLLGASVWYLIAHLVVWAARTWGVAAAGSGLAGIALLGLAAALAAAWRDHRQKRKPWREPTWIEREVLR